MYAGVSAVPIDPDTPAIKDPVLGLADGSVVSCKRPLKHPTGPDTLNMACSPYKVSSTVDPDGDVNLDHTLPPCPCTFEVDV